MEFRVLPAGDSGWLIELPERIDAEVNARAIQIARSVETAGLPITDVVVGYRSVMVYVDPLAEQAAGIERWLEAVAASPAASVDASRAMVDVPVCYDGPH